MSAQAFGDDEKAKLSSPYVNEGGHLPMQVNMDGTHLKRLRTRRRVFHFSALSLFALYLVPKWWSIMSGSENMVSDHVGGWEPYNWTAAKPSEKFEWDKCYDNFECARLSVPLDYSNPSGTKAAVAVIKLPANLSSKSVEYSGPVLINPGGPGGSGVATVLALGNKIQAVIGEQFDVIGFDPRGVGLTTPTSAAFSDKNEAGLFYIDFPMNVNTSAEALGKAYAYSDILGTKLEEFRNVTEYVSTPVVARDMLSISKAMGYEKLQYWGFSYGTVLGATFSAMFPDNVGRVVIDGVVDSENYYAGLWSNNLIDTDASLLDICGACVKAGPENCGLYENSTELVLQRINNLLEKLQLAPIPVYKEPSAYNPQAEYGIVDYEAVKGAIFGVLYNTHAAGGFLFNMLAELEKGVAMPWFQTSTMRAFRYLLTCDCPAPGHESPPFYGLFEHTLAIACGDSSLEDVTLEEVRTVYKDMAKLSTFSDVWAMHARCSGWKVKGKERFQGNFNHKTSHPLLLIGNTADPVTPLWAAHKMSKGFEGSVVLTQNSSGHCSISATSLCTAKAIRAYFQNGTLPKVGAVCETESKIFGNNNLLDDIDVSTMSSEELVLLEASHALQQNYFVPIHTLPVPSVLTAMKRMMII